MKRKKNETPLKLNKITVWRLRNSEMNGALGGIMTCPPTSINLGTLCQTIIDPPDHTSINTTP